MTKANECTCPSGDGSLRHPCPAHPASVELAGVGAKLTFINGRPAMCGCQVEYSSGGGEYSDVIDVTLCAKHSGSAILDLVATNRIALTPEYEGQWHADFYLDREIPLAKAEGATPAEAVLALMSAERIDPEQESVEQAGGDERVIGWRERILAAHPNSDPGFWPDALLVEHMAAEIADLRAALAQPSPVSEPLIYACKSLAQITSSDGSGHADIALAILRMAGVCDDERERLVNEWKAARAWKPSPAQAEQAEAERPEVVGYLSITGARLLREWGVTSIRREEFTPEACEPLMTVAQHERIVGALRARLQAAEDRADTLEHRMMGMMTRHFAEAWRNRDTQKALDGYLSAGIAQLEQERDAALAEVKRNKLTIAAMNEAHAKLAADLEAVQARVAELEKQEPAGAPMPDEIHQMAFEEGQPAEDGDGYLFSAEEFDLFVQRLLDSCAAPVAQPEETPGEILAAKLIETWVTKHGKPAPWSTAVEITAVATNMPNDERERLLALDDDVDAQAQHSVPEGWRIERSAERIVVMNLKNGAGYAAARDGESGIAESVLYLLAADLLAAAPGKEVGHE
ncbi:TPA: hypothetical protein L4W61_006092 [Pseudomonas aeruginosa]|nr:hypothetical protein [Pseudomonas aeruginosa]